MALPCDIASLPNSPAQRSQLRNAHARNVQMAEKAEAATPPSPPRMPCTRHESKAADTRKVRAMQLSGPVGSRDKHYAPPLNLSPHRPVTRKAVSLPIIFLVAAGYGQPGNEIATVNSMPHTDILTDPGPYPGTPKSPLTRAICNLMVRVPSLTVVFVNTPTNSLFSIAHDGTAILYFITANMKELIIIRP